MPECFNIIINSSIYRIKESVIEHLYKTHNNTRYSFLTINNANNFP